MVIERRERESESEGAAGRTLSTTTPAQELGEARREIGRLRTELARFAISTDPRQGELEREFLERLCARWRQGDHVYGGRSFEIGGPALVDEMTEEVIDLAGWALPLFARLRRLEASTARLEHLEEIRAAAVLAVKAGLATPDLARAVEGAA